LNLFTKIDPHIDYSNLELIIFDVDGTLYDQRKMRLFMLFEIVTFLIKNPTKYYHINILRHFRIEREIRSNEICKNLSLMQYKWVSDKLNIKQKLVEKIINEWMFERPLKYLKKCSYAGLNQLFKKLKKNNILITIYSDYPAKNKIKVLELPADLIVSSTDKNINRFKPDPKAIFYILDKFKINSNSHCLFIGDRFTKDGQCAINAGIRYQLVK
tara:strand:+ start:934 stop:1575 length:642 start_codon:yes stop_codon:yes gene_type:complete